MYTILLLFTITVHTPASKLKARLYTAMSRIRTCNYVSIATLIILNEIPDIKNLIFGRLQKQEGTYIATH